ncbi:hypothetical protein HMI56_005109 [Coelomomyces lativittatus]|nr:hypothetical protein HMI56_005109 [Coelomomyces lativittatus]
MSEVKLIGNISNNCIAFSVSQPGPLPEYDTPILSESCSIAFITFQLELRFGQKKGFPKLRVFKCQQKELVFQGVLIELTVACFEDTVVPK